MNARWRDRFWQNHNTTLGKPAEDDLGGSFPQLFGHLLDNGVFDSPSCCLANDTQWNHGGRHCLHWQAVDVVTEWTVRLDDHPLICGQPSEISSYLITTGN